MSNNTVDISGYLEILSIGRAFNGSEFVTQAKGWISTDTVPFGGRHPFIAAGKPADIILDHARQYAAETLPPDGQVGVTARGKLITLPGRCVLEVKNIYFFDTSNPAVVGEKDRFVANVVKLQGYLSVRSCARKKVQIGSSEVTCLQTWMATDKECLGGQHPILFEGRLAEIVYRAAAESSKDLPVTVGGKLLSLKDSIYIQADFVSLNKGCYRDIRCE